jgi:hypothetical protein
MYALVLFPDRSGVAFLGCHTSFHSPSRETLLGRAPRVTSSSDHHFGLTCDQQGVSASVFLKHANAQAYKDSWAICRTVHPQTDCLHRRTGTMSF